jgi:hypothetical protein
MQPQPSDDLSTISSQILSSEHTDSLQHGLQQPHAQPQRQGVFSHGEGIESSPLRDKTNEQSSTIQSVDAVSKHSPPTGVRLATPPPREGSPGERVAAYENDTGPSPVRVKEGPFFKVQKTKTNVDGHNFSPIAGVPNGVHDVYNLLHRSLISCRTSYAYTLSSPTPSIICCVSGVQAFPWPSH